MAKGGLLYKIQRRIRLQRVRRLLVWAGALFAAYALIGGPYGIIRYQLSKQRQRSLELESRKLTAQIMDLEQEIKRLKEDSLYIEKVARERYGYARPHERVHMITKH